MRVSPEVIAILDRCTVDGTKLFLPSGQLDRKDYVAVNKVIEAAGGKWNRSAKAHLFDEPATDTIERIILAGEVISAKQELGYFPTPPGVVATLIALAELKPDHALLEPSAGVGAIIKAVAPLVDWVGAVEVDQARAAQLGALGVPGTVQQADFLIVAPEAIYDRVVMNPPFARQQDVDHVLHALRFLRPGGLLVSVMSIGVMQRVNRKSDEFRKLVADRGGWFEELPADAFKAAGTGVHTVIVVIPEVAR